MPAVTITNNSPEHRLGQRYQQYAHFTLALTAVSDADTYTHNTTVFEAAWATTTAGDEVAPIIGTTVGTNDHIVTMNVSSGTAAGTLHIWSAK